MDAPGGDPAMKIKVSGVPYMIDVQDRKQLPVFFVGMTFGILLVLAIQRLLIEPPELPTIQRTPASQIVEAYKAGIADAVRTSPPSWHLEEACLEVWANKQPTQ
jgi:hypothetical protein